MEDKPEIPKTYTFWAILTSVFVSLPVGLIALYYGDRVKSRYRSHNYKGALQASKNARLFSFCFLILAFLIGMLYSVISGEAIEAMREGANAYSHF